MLHNYNSYTDETSSVWYQFHYLISQGFSEEDVIDLEKKSYNDVKGGGSLWNNLKDDFFRLYYKRQKQLLNDVT